MWKILTLIVLLCATSSAEKSPYNVQQVGNTCPTWTYPEPPSQYCMCGNGLQHIVICKSNGSQTEVKVILGYCITLDNNQSTEVVGPCPFNFKRQYVRRQYLTVPTEPFELDNAVCGYTNRTGQMCGQCMNGTSPPVYSYYPQCVHCPEGTNNWPKYLAVSLLPTTLFFLVAVAFRFRATSPLMIGFILCSQILTSPPVLRQVSFATFKEHYYEYLEIVIGFYISTHGIWNLDFFRMVYSPFCLHPNASTLQVLSLDYIIAAYPLALIVLTYTLVTLHYYNCRVVVWLWRPFHKCFARFRRQWDIQNSLVDGFATFLLLSYVKFLSVSFDILMPTILWDKWGQQKSIMLYYDGSVVYFGKEHLPYAILAIIFMLMFTLFPILLLCLYPCRWFQVSLNSCHLQSQALRIFMDTFQGCYKDGTNGTKDCRYFASLYLIARVLGYLSLGFYLVSQRASECVSIILILILLVTCFQPYKSAFYNKLDVFFFLIMISDFIILCSLQYEQSVPQFVFDQAALGVVMVCHMMYAVCLVLYCISRKSRRLQSAIVRIHTCLRREVRPDFKGSLPPRVIMAETSLLLQK